MAAACAGVHLCLISRHVRNAFHPSIAARGHGITLTGAVLAGTSPQARAGGCTRQAFTIGWDRQQVTCPRKARTGRQLHLRRREIRQALAGARAAGGSACFQAGCNRRAGVEGTMHQAASHGARRARYRGLPETRLDHAYMACALNLIRLGACRTGTPLGR